MATPSNPTGISTGQGRGEAQVFGNTYNPFFKEKLTDAKAKNKEVTDAMAKLSDPGSLWSRDVQAFKPKLDGLRQFYRDNAQKIIKGDFDTTLKLKQLQNDASQYITSSKSTEKYANELLKMLNKPGANYSDESRQRVLDFVNQRQAGDFDISKLRLDPKYNVNDSIDALQKSVGNLGYDLSTLKIVPKTITDKDGNKTVKNILVTQEGQPAGAIEDLISQRVAGDRGLFGDDQINKMWTPDFMNKTVSGLKNFINTKTKTSQVKDDSYWSSGSGQKMLDAASKLKRDTGLIQNFIPGRSEAVIANLADNGITVTHTAQDESLAKEHPGKSGILVEEGYGDKRKKYFIGTAAEDYKKLENLLRRTRLYSNMDEEALDKVPGFDATEEGKEIIKSQPKPLPRAEEVNNYITLLSNKLPKIDKDDINKLPSKIGGTDKFQNQLTNITERGIEGEGIEARSDFLNKALSDLKGQVVDLKAYEESLDKKSGDKDFDRDDSDRAVFSGVELLDGGDILKFNFENGDHIRIPYKNGKYEVGSVVKLLTGSEAGTKEKVVPSKGKGSELTFNMFKD